MTNIMGETGKDGMVSFIRRKLTEELVSEYPDLQADEESLSATLVRTAEMAGILPIKKDGSGSAISDFREYTMLEPGEFQPYVGFMEKEIRFGLLSNNSTFSSSSNFFSMALIAGWETCNVSAAFVSEPVSARNRGGWRRVRENRQCKYGSGRKCRKCHGGCCYRSGKQRKCG